MATSPRWSPSCLHGFDVDLAFVVRRLAYIDRFVTGVDEVLAGAPLSRKIICSRYTVGMPQLELGALRAFRLELDDYRTAVRDGIRSGR